MVRRLCILCFLVALWPGLALAQSAAALKALRADLIDPKLTEHNGRIVKLMGDGMLVEFLRT